jgi:hypothetical protein
LNRSWVVDVYYPHLKDVLLKRELSRVAESVPHAEAEMERRRLVAQNAEFEKQVKEGLRKVHKLRDAIIANRYRINGEEVPAAYLNDLVDGKEIKVDSQKKFVMRCPSDGCNGFLSTQYKCGICAKATCSDCLVVLSGSKEDHTCVESDRLSAEHIKAKFRPCPVCGVRIERSYGCDQMFCIAKKEGGGVCETAFSWKTGKIEKGIVHNPYYYELQRQRSGAAPRNIGDVACGGMPHIGDVLRAIDRLGKAPETVQLRVKVQTIHARVSELTQYTINAMRQRVRNLQEPHRCRVKFILKEISERDLSSLVFKKNWELARVVDEYNIMEVLTNSGIDTFRTIAAETPPYLHVALLTAESPSFGVEMMTSIRGHLVNLDKVRQYCNAQLVNVSVTYNCTVRCYGEDFESFSRKFKIKDAVQND